MYLGIERASFVVLRPLALASFVYLIDKRIDG